MLGDNERQILGKLNGAEYLLLDARAKAITQRQDSIAAELRIVAIALSAIQGGIMDDLPEYKQDNNQ